MVDSHTHSRHSHDGTVPIPELILAAKEKGLSYLAVTDHLDRDYRYCGRERFVRQLNLPKYYKAFEEAKPLAGDMLLAFGVECGYSPESEHVYVKELPKYPFDVIINSVHTMYKKDLYILKPEKMPPKEILYREYLENILKSVKCAYDYDIVGHIGYAARYVDYEDKALLFPLTADLIDEILTEIIARGKTVEINTNVKNMDIPATPEYAILERYRALGGKQVVFSSDAHQTARIADKYEMIAETAKNLGFTHWTVYENRRKKEIPI